VLLPTQKSAANIAGGFGKARTHTKSIDEFQETISVERWDAAGT